MKFIYPFISFLALIFNHTDIVAEKIYLPKVYWCDNIAIESMIKNAIHEFDSIGISKKEIVMSHFYEKNDTLLCLFYPLDLKLVRSKTNLRGYYFLDNRFFFIFSDEESQNRFKHSIRKKSFIINNPNIVGAVDGFYLYYMVVGDSFKEIPYIEWDHLYVDMFVKFKQKSKN